MLVFAERGKPEYLEKNLQEQRREPTTNSTQMWRRCRNVNSGPIGGRRVLSTLHFPCSPISITIKTMLILNYKKTAHYYKFCNNELFFVVDCLPEVLQASVLHPHPIRWRRQITVIIPLHDKFLQFDWLRAVVFQLNLKYLHVKITNLLRVVV